MIDFFIRKNNLKIKGQARSGNMPIVKGSRVILIILDGWGISGNTILQASTSFYNYLKCNNFRNTIGAERQKCYVRFL